MSHRVDRAATTRPDRRAGTVRRSTAAVVTIWSVLTVATAGLAHAEPGAELGARCPALYVLGVQGPEETAPDASPTSDTGALGQLFTPLHAAAGELMNRLYVPYGYSGDGTEQPYDQAVPAAAQRLTDTATEVVRRCPDTKVAVAGYGQGAAAAAEFAHQVGTTTSGSVPAAAVAGVALFANPHRGPGPVLPGRPAQTGPDPVPGTPGTAVAAIRFTTAPTTGTGIAPTAAGTTDYGALTGRVADFCATADLTCDAPAGDTPITRTVRNIAAQSDLRDPVTAITTTAQALAATAWKTAVGVAGEDLAGNSLDQLSYQPAKTLGQRLAEASDPTTPLPGPDDALAAVFRIGTIGFNTVVTVARKVFTPATIAELATVGLADPVAGLAILGIRLAAAVADLVPPQTALSWVDQAFDAVRSTVTSDSDLYQLATRTRYSDTDGRHTAYTTTAATPSGQAPLAAAADWFTALARDLAATHPATHTPAPASTTPRVGATAAPDSAAASAPPSPTG
ncbi:cutinase family protein [Nocardia wallacei]|uniref:cutinase family protein n=1 Tax=Nocardia wallacei TaxID=480035 RepID=UPI0024569D6F|nr:cutinase family protein [Nocardia wallacei]